MPESYHIDHVVPISRGGANSIGNIVAACGSCNSSKNDRLLTEWRLIKGRGRLMEFGEGFRIL